MPQYLTDTAATIAWGADLAPSLRGGDVIALCGQLGAGKTHVTKGILAGLGSLEDVTSPTFTLVHEYKKARLPVFHFDFYRVDRPADILAIGWDEYLDESGIIIVEWPDLHPQLLPPQARWYRLSIAAEGGRTIEKIPHALTDSR
jgi:tRNA threonylcarbamoyladenosine biosynthesis protein TsaE